jgi:hypothetical protein
LKTDGRVEIAALGNRATKRKGRNSRKVGSGERGLRGRQNKKCGRAEEMAERYGK